jgi:hypothetical protein
MREVAKIRFLLVIAAKSLSIISYQLIGHRPRSVASAIWSFIDETRSSEATLIRRSAIRNPKLFYRFFFAQAPTRSSAFSMFSIELATLKRK